MFGKHKKPTLDQLGIDFDDWQLQPIKDTLRYSSQRDALKMLRRLYPKLSKRKAQAAIEAIAAGLELPQQPATTTRPATSSPSASIDLSAPEFEPVRHFIATGKKINAIKELRNITRLGLKDAKDVVDAYMAQPQRPTTDMPGLQRVRASRPAGDIDLHDPLFDAVREWLSQGRKIDAIKELRRSHPARLGLKEAKEIVDQMADQMR